MLTHFAIHSFVPVCQQIAKHDHIMCSHNLVDVNCDGCLEIVEGIVTQYDVLLDNRSK